MKFTHILSLLCLRPFKTPHLPSSATKKSTSCCFIAVDKCLPTPYSWVPKTQIRLQGKSRLLCNLVRLFPCEVLLYCKHRADNAFIREMAAAMRFHNTHDFRCIVTYIWSCVSTLFLIFFEKNLVLRLKQCCVILEKCVHRPALLRQIFCGH